MILFVKFHTEITVDTRNFIFIIKDRTPLVALAGSVDQFTLQQRKVMHLVKKVTQQFSTRSRREGKPTYFEQSTSGVTL